MSKRTPGLARRPRDKWPTIDPRAAAALAPHIKPGMRYIEPCAGDLSLVKLLNEIGLICDFASDIEPEHVAVCPVDCFKINDLRGRPIITNPPWSRPLLHRIIRHFAPMGEAWFLFDADWMHTHQAAEFEPWLTDIVSVGRLRWLKEGEEGDKGTDGFDNCAWYRFGPDKFGATRFWPRQGKDQKLASAGSVAQGSPS